MTKLRLLIGTSITAFALFGAVVLVAAPANAQPAPTTVSAGVPDGFIW